MSIRRKIDAMHDLFGVQQDKRCEECSNLLQGDYHGRHYRKCLVYGASHSEATDWRKRYVACGMYNREWAGNPIVDTNRRKDAPTEPCEGQIKMGDDNA